jgi:hypothetical protein
MSYNVEDYLAEVPDEEVLFSVSPPAARMFWVLPIRVRKPENSEPILDVVGIEDRSQVKPVDGWQMFRKIINYLGSVKEDIWEDAYRRFYSELLKGADLD